MKIKLLIFSILTAVALTVVAQTHSSDAQGYLDRGRAMLRDKNYTGLSQQMSQLARLNPTLAQSAEGRRLKAIASLHLPGQPDALELIESWLEDFPGDRNYPQMVALKGDYYFFDGEYHTAIDIYSSLDTSLLDMTTAADVDYRLGYSKMMLGESEAAAQLFSNLRGDREWGAAANFYLGYLAYAEGDYQKALQYLPAATSNPDFGPAAEYYIAQIYFAQGNYKESLPLAQKLVKENRIGEFYGEACRIAGESLFNLGREDEALPYLRKYAAVTSNPVPSASYILGVGEYKEGNYLEAVASLTRAAGDDNAMGQSANLFMGQSYVGLGKTDAALMCFEKAYRMRYDREVAESALYNYAVAKSEGGRVPFGNSISLFEDFLKQYPDSKYADSVREYMIAGYMSDNDYGQALRVIDSTRNPSVEMVKAKQQCLFALGTREYETGNVASALNRFRQAALITKADAKIARESLLWQGTCQYDLGQYAEAVKSFQSFIQASPSKDSNMVLARYDLGYSRFAMKDYKQALTNFKDVIQLNPDKRMLADAYNRAGDCLYYQSDFAGAENYYRKSYETDPTTGDYALYQQAFMKGLRRDYSSKITGMDEMIEKYPQSALVPAAILEKAESYSAMGNEISAISNYRKLIEDYGTTSYGRKAALQLAITYQSQGKSEDAISAYRYVISTYPTSEEAKLASDDLKGIYADRGNLNEFRRFINSVPGAPAVEVSELDALSFRRAEADYVNNGEIGRIETYMREYPQGIYMAQALYFMSESEQKKGNAENALRYAMQVTENYPDSEVAPEALLIKAESEELTGEKEGALRSYQSLEKIASGSKLTQKARLGILRNGNELGRYDEALAAAEKIGASGLDLNEQKEVEYLKAVALYGKGRKNEAMTMWEALSSEPSNIHGSKAAVNLAEAQLAAGNADAAVATADKLINANPPHQYWLARAFIVLSDGLRVQGNEFEADEYLRSLKTNYPGNESDIFEMINKRLN